MKSQTQTQICCSGTQKKYQKMILISRHKIVRQNLILWKKVILRQNLILRQMALRHPRRQSPHPRSVMPPQWRNQCRHTLYR